MTDTKHTPTPWVMAWDDKSSEREWIDGIEPTIEIETAASGTGARFICAVKGNGGPEQIDIDEEDIANAAFIVRACNAHDALVEALEEARWKLEDAYIGMDLANEFPDVLAALDSARAAIAKAKGEQA